MIYIVNHRTIILFILIYANDILIFSPHLHATSTSSFSMTHIYIYAISIKCDATAKSAFKLRIEIQLLLALLLLDYIPLRSSHCQSRKIAKSNIFHLNNYDVHHRESVRFHFSPLNRAHRRLGCLIPEKP